jgi:ribosomal protein L37AE/L43A
MATNKWDERKKAMEDEYFVKKERELLEKMRAKQAAETKTAASMKCPKCGQPLKERSFQKIVIDQCTGCNGIWLDAGELEQVAEKDAGSWLGKFWQKNG